MERKQLLMKHIPSGNTSDSEVLTFDDALNRTNDDYDREKWLYVPDYYSEYRYILGTRGERPLIVIGINPSTAAPDALDNTLKSAERVAHFNGYDSFLMFNVYAQRATDPDMMETVFNPVLHRENLKAFDYLLSLTREPHVWAAWGTIVLKRDYLLTCLSDIAETGRRHNAEWFTCGARSKNGGHPHHPLYLKKDSVLESFDIDEYLRGLEKQKK